MCAARAAALQNNVLGRDQQANPDGRRLPYAAVEEGNAQENILARPGMARPPLRFGCSVEDMFGSSPSSAEVQVLPHLRRAAPCSMCPASCDVWTVLT